MVSTRLSGEGEGLLSFQRVFKRQVDAWVMNSSRLFDKKTSMINKMSVILRRNLQVKGLAYA
jgi:hypothetical protein